jgi:hypothetical protein
VMAFLKRQVCRTALCGLSVILSFGMQAKAENNTPSTCRLNHAGDCCTVTIDGNHDAALNTAIISGAQVDYVLIMNKGQSDCIFLYDGEMQTPMQSYVGGFNGTWLGGNFNLSYQNDAADKGSCLLDIYYMTIGHVFPKACVKNHFESAFEKNSEAQSKDTDSKMTPESKNTE